MRALKKTLCLALALVLMLGLCAVSASATSFRDENRINDTYAEAAEVLNGIGVFVGDTTGNFNPTADITRAEVAAVLYRIWTGDVKNNQISLYKDWNYFTDVTSDKWYAGYVNLVANAELVKGRGGDIFDPTGKVTGYEVLAMMLRAIGYGKDGEFEGAGWQIQTAATAKRLGITDRIDTTTLGAYATREEVAEMIFEAIQVPTVTYTMLGGYNEYDNVLGWGATKNFSLGEQNFNLYKSENTQIDDWGRPGYYWGKAATPGDAQGFNEDKDGTKPSNKKNIYAEMVYPVETYYTTLTAQCDIVDDLGEDDDVTVFDLWANSRRYTGADTLRDNFNLSNGKILKATDIKENVGGVGRLTEVYHCDVDNDGSDEYRIVMIDTFLAKVTKVVDHTVDRAGHVDKEAEITLEAYSSRSIDTPVTISQKNGDKDYPYAKGDYVLIYAKADTNVYQKLDNCRFEILQEAPVLSNVKQTKYSTTDKYSIIGGDTYNWAQQYSMGRPGTTDASYDAYTDLYGNLIGLDTVSTSKTVGIIDAIKWYDNDQDLKDSYALGNLISVDRTESGNVKLDKFNGSDFNESTPGSTPNGDLSQNQQTNAPIYAHNYIYKYTVNDKGVYTITDVGTVPAMTNIEKGIPNMLNTDKVTTSKTVYLVETLDDDDNSVYNTYTGYSSVPSYNNVKVSYFLGDDNKEITYMYVNATAATSTDSGTILAYIYDTGADGHAGGNALYDVWEWGERKQYSLASGYTATAFASDFTTAGSEGLYELTMTGNKISGIRAVVNGSSLNTGLKYKYVYEGSPNTNITFNNNTTIYANGVAYNAENVTYYEIGATAADGITKTDVDTFKEKNDGTIGEVVFVLSAEKTISTVYYAFA